MRNFLTLDDLSEKEILKLVKDALLFKKNEIECDLKGKIIANMFFENSTRTQYSFNTAEEKLGMKVITFNPATSSLNKGESFYDTVKTFESFGIDGMVIRHTNNEYYKELKDIKSVLINAGDGTGNHPSQSLLDLVTIYEQFNKFDNLNIAIVGDILHSRVAHGNLKVMERLGMNTYISGPKEFMDNSSKFIPFKDAISEMDIIMLLRIQRERNAVKSMSDSEYLENYGLTMDKVNAMKKDAIIMHPAPFNRNVEIADDVVECPKSKIFTQMNNGVYARCSILNHCFK
ncbi:MAG: aspartate carbamoyltransferase catalytic subunit [Tenericutes bacterium]|nr:aspartate carbamoyltransferase catalytic subunit [Mycoplasmatota bacterium]